MGSFYFFTETGLLIKQRRREAFGPARTSSGNHRYRTTSMHRATANPAAFAVCPGSICVQEIPNTNPALVNLVLKPDKQPALNFARIKYIIYKGILKASLINGSEVAQATTNDLTQYIWDEQDKKNKAAGSTAAPAAEALGMGLTAAVGAEFGDDKPIDNLFFRTGVSFQPPPVKQGGWKIGQFDKSGFGIEILLDGLGYHHPISLARTLRNVVSVPSLPSSATPAEKLEHRHAKEQVLGFMDPCAFYGSFFRVEVLASKNAPVFEAKDGKGIYLDVLPTFRNRDTAYLDIRNEHNYSLNYFGNYGDNIQLSFDPANAVPAPVDYYGSGWPLLALKATSFPSGNTLRAHNAFQIQLPVGDNPLPLLYVSQGYRGTASDEFPAELTGAERFIEGFTAVTGGFTQTGSTAASTMTFVVPNVAGQSGTTPVSCYIRLKYLKQRQPGVAPSPAAPTSIQAPHYLDNLIYPLDLRIPFAGSSSIMSAVYDEEIYVDARDLAALGCDFIGKMGIARDKDDTTFFVIPTLVHTRKGPAFLPLDLIGEISDYQGHYPNFIALKHALERVRVTPLQVTTTGARIAEFVSEADAAAVKQFSIPDYSKLIAIVVSNGTYKEWQNVLHMIGVPIEGRFRVYLGVKHVQQNQTDSSGVKYTSFELTLRGFGLDTSTNSYKVQETNWNWINIEVYTHVGA